MSFLGKETTQLPVGKNRPKLPPNVKMESVGDDEFGEAMKTFYLNRKVDKSGISGTGLVAEGVEFSNGKCVLCWMTKNSSLGVYDSIEILMAVHGHNGDTELVWLGE